MCTSETVLPTELNVCILKKKSNNTICFSRFEVIKYMMAKMAPEKIKYYRASYNESPDFDVATKRIQDKVKKYYTTHIKEIEKYKNDAYLLGYIPLADFVNRYLNNL